MKLKKLNVDLTWEEIFTAIKNKKSIQFIAARNDIGFQNVENDFPSQNWAFPFIMAIVAIPGIEFIFHAEASGFANPLTNIQRMQLGTELHGGVIFYEKIGSGDEWKVSIIFKEKNI